MEFKHTPVLLKEVIEGLNINPSGFYLDCTLGGAGHSSEILKRLNRNGMLIGFDKDSDAIKASSERLEEISNIFIYNREKDNFCNNKTSTTLFNEISNIKPKKSLPTCIIIRDDFKNSPDLLKKIKCPKLDGILVDLGVSSYQIDNSERGFSFRADGDLDMRMDQSQSLTAKEIVNSYSEQELTTIFFKYGEEEFSRSIARNIIKFREKKEIQTTKELNEIIENSMPKKVLYSRGGASKKVFQALRIEVNSELTDLDNFLKSLSPLLNKEGRICVISFHSLEDRIVKEVFKELSTSCICPPFFPICVCGHTANLKLINRKPVIASEEELSLNSRAGSAKLRIVEKL